MAQTTCGSVLRFAREKKGYGLETVARRLRIRPDILEAIENNDFSSMPPRGYTRNMINAYARFLGLNPTEIVNMYLDDVSAHQVKNVRAAKDPHANFEIGHEKRLSRNRDKETDTTSSRESRESRDAIRSSERAAYNSASGGYRTRMGRDLYDDRTEYARSGYGARKHTDSEPFTDEPAFSRARNERTPSTDASTRGDAATRRRTSRRGETPNVSRGLTTAFGAVGGVASDFLSSASPRKKGPSSVNSTYGNMYGGRSNKGLVEHMPIIVVAGVLLIILIIVLSIVIGSRGNAQTDVSTLPVTGISDTTTEEDEEITPVKEVAPTSVTVKYDVKSGQSAYVEIFIDDGDAQPLMLTGPTSQTVDVTGKWTIATWAKDAITLTVDGEKVDMQTSQDYDGMYAYTVDFNKILDEWNATHNTKTSSSASSSESSSNSNSASSSSSSSSSSSASSSSSTATGTPTSTSSTN